MTYRDALFIGAIVALGATGAIAMATIDQLPYGGQEVRAEVIGFDALAHRVFGGDDCTASMTLELRSDRQLH